MRRVGIGAVLALALVAAFGSATGALAATPLDCGTIITANTTLTADVGPCNQGGLVIGASGITLDLGEHTIQGKARIGDGIGVLFNDVSNSRVTNGTVTGFDAGACTSWAVAPTESTPSPPKAISAAPPEAAGRRHPHLPVEQQRRHP